MISAFYVGPFIARAPNGDTDIMKNVKAEFMEESNIAQGIPLIPTGFGDR